ncbi:ABC transporter substrate-binding protein [Denitrobaculum tricleocarpae]|uniref:ABC transporter substrate-binding protein n=1 Tax=Denitrobaculum tricleocarpae TaxID=2591009 RepID=A0A545TEX6_9PROT|nr:ABC transporter substrate-binding protein [Denitrobaculum tricleocarpae]TQV75783.1 ABC transporter substrate-binding protein [Denitrobaculum tricleocarpae]
MSDELKDLGMLVARGQVSRRDFLGRAAALGVAAPLATSLLSSTVLAAGPKKGGHLKLGMNGGTSADSLDPATFASSIPFTFGRVWGETLTETSPVDGKPVPVLAESWEASEDAKSWRFKIRKGVTFHNGKEMTADDVVATLLRHSDENAKSGALGVMKTIQGIKKDGDDGVLVTLDSGNADLPYMLSDYHLIIQPNGGNDDPAAGIATGPYKVSVNEPGVRYAAERYEGHWRPEVGHADSVEILVINDLTARMAALTSGQVHMINRVDPKTIGLLKRAPTVSIANTAGRGHYVFIMHTDKEPFTNVDLRLALKYAMNREQMVEQILRGYGTVGNDFPINGAYANFPDDIPQRTFDPDKAKFHFKKSGHDGAVLLRTSNAAFNGAEDAAVLFQQSCAQAGIEIEIKREPADGYWSNVWNVQPFCTSYWGGRPTQDQMYSVAYQTGADWNDTKWSRPAFDELLVAARAELDDARRKELYREMALMVRDDGGLILPMFNDFIAAVSNKVDGYVHDAGGEMSNGFAAIRAWLV